MRLVGLVLGTVLGLTVIAQGAYLLRTRRQVEELSARLEALGAAGDRVRPDPAPVRARGEGARELPVPDDAEPGPADRPGRRPPPRLLAPAAPAAPGGDDPLPLPPGLDGAEAREQLRQFVLAQLARQRQENRLAQEDRRQQRDQREAERRDRMARELGLSPAETERWNQIFAEGRAARERLRAQVEAGELSMDGIRQAMLDTRRANERQLRDLLGEARMKQYEELRGPLPGPGGRGFGPGLWREAEGASRAPPQP